MRCTLLSHSARASLRRWSRGRCSDGGRRASPTFSKMSANGTVRSARVGPPLPLGWPRDAPARSGPERKGALHQAGRGVSRRVPSISTPNGAELTLLFVPARIRSRARQKGWGPFSNWYKSRGGGVVQYCPRWSRKACGDTPPGEGPVVAQRCWLVSADAWVVWA
jgi:hypothetical protein